MEPLAFSIEAVCESTGLSRTSIYEAIKGGRLVARKFGRRTLITSDDLTDFLNELPTIHEAPRAEAAGD